MFFPANIFQPLIDVFEAVLKFLHNHVGVAWGLAIVLLTILVRAVLIPLTVKQYHSMQRLQRLQPELKAIQNRYKDDKQRQQQEIMKFYKENQVNPFGSCLPLVAQLPVFIALYYMLRTSLRVDICPEKQHYKYVGGKKVLESTVPCGAHHGAGFLFIPDLTNHATGIVLAVLVVLYVGTQLVSSLMMSSTMDKTQRQLMLFMPLVFVLFIIRFPAGVLVYWITTNTWTIGQQYVVRRRIGPMGPPQPASAGGSVSPGAANGAGLGGLGSLLRPKPKAQAEAAGVGAGSSAVASGGESSSRGGSSRSAGAGAAGGGRGEGERVARGGVARGARTTPPPPSPRKKKKRSGRRR